MREGKLLGLRLWLAVGMLVLLPLFVRIGYHKLIHDNPPVYAQPSIAFTLKLRELHKIQGKQVRVARELIIARRSDGARSETETMFPGQPQEIRKRTVLLPDFTEITAMDKVNLKTTLPLHPRMVDQLKLRPQAASQCRQNGLGANAFPKEYAIAGTDVIQGLQAVKMVRENYHTEAWHAPALDCEEVRRVIVFPTLGGQFIENSSELEMTSYLIADPDPALFAVGHLQEASPVQATEAAFRAAGVPEDIIRAGTSDLQQRETRYHEERQQRSR